MLCLHNQSAARTRRSAAPSLLVSHRGAKGGGDALTLGTTLSAHGRDVAMNGIYDELGRSSTASVVSASDVALSDVPVSVAQSCSAVLGEMGQKSTALCTSTALTVVCKRVLERVCPLSTVDNSVLELKKKITDPVVQAEIRRLFCPIDVDSPLSSNSTGQPFFLSPFGSTTGGWKSMQKSVEQEELLPQHSVCPMRSLCINVPVGYFSGQAREPGDMEFSTEGNEQVRLKDMAALLGMMYAGTSKDLPTDADEPVLQQAGSRKGAPAPADYKMRYRDSVNQKFAIAYEELYDENMESVVAVRFWKLVFDSQLSDSALWDQVIAENKRVRANGHISGSQAATSNPKLVAESKDVSSLLSSEDRRAMFTVQYARITGMQKLFDAVQNYGGGTLAEQCLAPCVDFGAMDTQVRASMVHETLSAKEGEDDNERYYGGTNVLSPEYLFNAQRAEALVAGLVYKGRKVAICAAQRKVRTYFDACQDGESKHMHEFALHRTRESESLGTLEDDRFGDGDMQQPQQASTISERNKLFQKGGFFLNVSPDQRTVFGIPFPRPLSGCLGFGASLYDASSLLLGKTSSVGQRAPNVYALVMETLEGGDVNAMVEAEQQERDVRSSDTRSAAGGPGASTAASAQYSVHGTAKERIKQTRNRVTELAQGTNRLCTRVLSKSTQHGEMLLEAMERRFHRLARSSCKSSAADTYDLLLDQVGSILRSADGDFEERPNVGSLCDNAILMEVVSHKARAVFERAVAQRPGLLSSWSFVSKVKDVVKSSLAYSAALGADLASHEYGGGSNDGIFALGYGDEEEIYLTDETKAYWKRTFFAMARNAYVDLLEIICGSSVEDKVEVWTNEDIRTCAVERIAKAVVGMRLRDACDRMMIGDCVHEAPAERILPVVAARMQARAVGAQLEQHRALLLRDIFEVHQQRIDRSLRSSVEREVVPRGWLAPFDYLQSLAQEDWNKSHTASVAFFNPNAPNDITESDRSTLSQYWEWMHKEIFVGVGKIGGPDVQLIDALWLHCFEVYADSTFLFMLCGEKGTGKSSRTERLQDMMPKGMLKTAGTRSTMAGMNGGNDDCNGCTTLRQEMPQDLLNATPGSMPLEYWKTILTERQYSHSRSVPSKDGEYNTVSLVTEHQEGHVVTSNWGQSFSSGRTTVSEEGAMALRDRTVSYMVRPMASAGTNNNEADFKQALSSAAGEERVRKFKTVTSLVAMTLLLLRKVPALGPDFSYAEAMFSYLDEKMLVQEYNMPRKKPRRNKKRSTDLLTLTVLASVVRVFFYASTAVQFESGGVKRDPATQKLLPQRFSLALLWDVIADLHPSMEVILLAWSQGLDYDPNTSSHQLNSMTAICKFFGFNATDMLHAPFSNDAYNQTFRCASVGDLPRGSDGEPTLPEETIKAALDNSLARLFPENRHGDREARTKKGIGMGIPTFHVHPDTDGRHGAGQSSVLFHKGYLRASRVALANTRRVSNAFRAAAHKNQSAAASSTDPAAVIEQVLADADVLGVDRAAFEATEGATPMDVDCGRAGGEEAEAEMMQREAAVAAMEQNAHSELYMSPHSSAMMANIAVVCSLYEFEDALKWINGESLTLNNGEDACRIFLGTKQNIHFQNLERSDDAPARYDVSFLSKTVGTSIRESDTGTNFWTKAVDAVETCSGSRCSDGAAGAGNEVYRALALSKDVLRDSIIAYTQPDAACRIGRGKIINCNNSDSLGVCALQNSDRETCVQAKASRLPLFFKQSDSYRFVSAAGADDARQNFAFPPVDTEVKKYNWKVEVELLKQSEEKQGLLRNRGATPYVEERAAVEPLVDLAVRRNRFDCLSALHSRDVLLAPPMKSSFSQNEGSLHCALTHAVSHVSLVAESLARLSLFPGCSSRQERGPNQSSVKGTMPPEAYVALDAKIAQAAAGITRIQQQRSSLLSGGQGYTNVHLADQPTFKDGVKQLSYFYHVIQASISIDAYTHVYHKDPLAHARRMQQLGFVLPADEGAALAPELLLRYTSITENDLERTNLSVPICKMAKAHVGHVEVADAWTKIAVDEEELQRELVKASHVRGREVSEVELEHMKRSEMGAASMHGATGDLFDVHTWQLHAVESKSRRGFLPRRSGLEVLRIKDAHYNLMARCLRAAAQHPESTALHPARPFEAEDWEAAVRTLSAIPLAPKAMPTEEDEEVLAGRKRRVPDEETRTLAEKREKRRAIRPAAERPDF